jgi:hypothetical protein
VGRAVYFSQLSEDRMTGGFSIDKTGLPCAIGASLVSFQPGQMKAGKVRNGVDTLLYEYTVIIAWIFARQKNIPFVQGRSINPALVAGTGLEPASR